MRYITRTAEMKLLYATRSSAVAVIADHSAYDA